MNSIIANRWSTLSNSMDRSFTIWPRLAASLEQPCQRLNTADVMSWTSATQIYQKALSLVRSYLLTARFQLSCFSSMKACQPSQQSSSVSYGWLFEFSKTGPSDAGYHLGPLDGHWSETSVIFLRKTAGSPSANGQNNMVSHYLIIRTNILNTHTLGDMTYISLLGTDIIIVNSLTVLSALHETNDDICSDRPSLYFAYEMVGWRELALSMNVGPEHTAHRKLIAKTIGTKAAMASLQDKIDHQAQCFVKRIIDHPEHLYRHVRTSVRRSLVVLVVLMWCLVLRLELYCPLHTATMSTVLMTNLLSWPKKSSQTWVLFLHQVLTLWTLSLHVSTCSLTSEDAHSQLHSKISACMVSWRRVQEGSSFNAS